jgi:hypothetical protein
MLDGRPIPSRASTRTAHFRLYFATGPAYRSPVARIVPPVDIAGVTYRVLRLEGARGPRFLLRTEAGDLVGLFPCNGQPARLVAAPLVAGRSPRSPFATVEFFEVDGRLLVR